MKNIKSNLIFLVIFVGSGILALIESLYFNLNMILLFSLLIGVALSFATYSILTHHTNR